MTEALQQLLERYPRRTREDTRSALREILQQLALLGLWRAKFFEHAAFYGGTAIRILYGLDRFSEDLDFSLLRPNPDFTLESYGEALRREMASFGFEVNFERRVKTANTRIESAFLKTNTLRQMIAIQADPALLGGQHAKELLKIKLEVDVDPPGGFQTEIRPVLLPIAFAVRTYTLPDLFAGKLHAVLCRRWKGRVKGRDWYDFVWYLARHPRVRLSHLEARMRQSGDWEGGASLTRNDLIARLELAIEALDVDQARREVARFVKDTDQLEVWSASFFKGLLDRIETV